MARDKYIDTSPRFLQVDLARQLLPGTFEHALNHLLDRERDLSHSDTRYRNDATGAPAFSPAMLLKVVLFAYSRGLVSSRRIARAMPGACDVHRVVWRQRAPFHHHRGLRQSRPADMAQVFAAVLAICDAQGLIGREMFAIDGVKLPSNASKHRSGTRADLAHPAAKLEAAATTMLERHRETDALPVEPDVEAKTAQRLQRLERDAVQMREWLATQPNDRLGAKGAVRLSNRTDNERAKMATSKGAFFRGRMGNGSAAVTSRT